MVLVINVAVEDIVDGALVEGHNVLGEGTGLVGEDVLDLTELLVQGGGACARRNVRLVVVHLDVPVDPEALHGADELDADVEGDGHHRVQNDQVGEEDEQRDGGGARVPLAAQEGLPGQVDLEVVASE